jgi:hypothetical protein
MRDMHLLAQAQLACLGGQQWCHFFCKQAAVPGCETGNRLRKIYGGSDEINSVLTYRVIALAAWSSSIFTACHYGCMFDLGQLLGRDWPLTLDPLCAILRPEQ